MGRGEEGGGGSFRLRLREMANTWKPLARYLLRKRTERSVGRQNHENRMELEPVMILNCKQHTYSG